MIAIKETSETFLLASFKFLSFSKKIMPEKIYAIRYAKNIPLQTPLRISIETAYETASSRIDIIKRYSQRKDVLEVKAIKQILFPSGIETLVH